MHLVTGALSGQNSSLIAAFALAVLPRLVVVLEDESIFCIADLYGKDIIVNADATRRLIDLPERLINHALELQAWEVSACVHINIWHGWVIFNEFGIRATDIILFQELFYMLDLGIVIARFPYPELAHICQIILSTQISKETLLHVGEFLIRLHKDELLHQGELIRVELINWRYNHHGYLKRY